MWLSQHREVALNIIFLVKAAVCAPSPRGTQETWTLLVPVQGTSWCPSDDGAPQDMAQTPSSWVWRGGEVNPRHAQHVALLTLGPKCSLLASIFIVAPANPSSRMPGVIFSSLPPYWWAPFNPVTGTAIFKVGLSDAPSPAFCFTCF